VNCILLFFVLSSNLTLYVSPDLSGQPLVHITNHSFANLNSNMISSIQVNGGCQWILYEGSFLSRGNSLHSSVIGPGPETYLNANFGIPNNSLTSVRRLPTSGTMAIVLFEHLRYYGRELELSSSNASLTSANFDDRTSSFIVTGGIWQLYSERYYQGGNVTFGEGIYNLSHLENTISNDALSSVRLVGKRNMLLINDMHVQFTETTHKDVAKCLSARQLILQCRPRAQLAFVYIYIYIYVCGNS